MSYLRMCLPPDLIAHMKLGWLKNLLKGRLSLSPKGFVFLERMLLI